MNTSTPTVLMLPPRPPATLNTVILAAGSLVLSLASVGTFCSISEFPANSPIEQVLAVFSSFILFVLSFILGFTAIMNESRRKQYHHVVMRYTKVTGDKRYLPFILPIRIKIVTILFIAAMITPVVAYIIAYNLDRMN